MSKNKDLFKEAIADANTVREAALANAKIALEEALAPKIQNMISAKLQEMESAEDLDEAEDKDEMNEDYSETDDDDLDLSEILAELDMDDEVNEAKKKDDEKSKKSDKKKEESEDEESEEDEKITDLTVDELKDMIKDIVSSELEAEEYETSEDEEAEMGADDMSLGGEGDMEVNDDEEFNLEELLAELDSLNEGEDADDMHEGAASDFIKKIGELSADKLAKLKKFYQDEISPSSVKPGGKYYGKHTTLPSNLEEEDDMEEGLGDTVKKIGTAVKKGVGNVKKAWKDEYSPAAMKKAVAAGKGYSKLASNLEEEDEMNEAIRTINTLRNELNETNLLNAKLLYVNRIFKDRNLTESQKLKVIAQFDKATTTKEAKNLYESLNSVLGFNKKNTIKESLGFASKAAGIAPQKQIVQVDGTVARWQTLAGISKLK